MWRCLVPSSLFLFRLFAIFSKLFIEFSMLDFELALLIAELVFDHDFSVATFVSRSFSRSFLRAL
jgi:hypothetical protein